MNEYYIRHGIKNMGMTYKLVTSYNYKHTKHYRIFINNKYLYSIDANYSYYKTLQLLRNLIAREII